jgi:tetraacyldisaccharide 4'-kinase
MINNRLLSALFLVGRIFSPLYGLIMRVRALLYARGVLASTRLSLPVISVGNLSMGGTGKTPMVIYLARLLSRQSLRPGVVSRGYGGHSRLPVNLVSDGVHTLLSASEAGDEPVLLAGSLPGVPIVTARKRALGGRFLAQQGLADLLILDDGFQHLALHRDLNLVMISARSSIQSDWVFPGGMLREPRSALSRADCFVLSGGGEDQSRNQTKALREWLRQRYPEIPVYEGGYQTVGLYRQGRGKVDLGELAGVPLFAFCGLANPQSFRHTLDRDFLIQGWQSFADHHPFTGADLETLVGRAVAAGCSGLITTEKDFVKIKSLPVALPLWVLTIELRMDPAFDRFVLERIGRRTGKV